MIVVGDARGAIIVVLDGCCAGPAWCRLRIIVVRLAKSAVIVETVVGAELA